MREKKGTRSERSTRAAKTWVSEKRRKGRRGEPVSIFLNTSIRPLPRPPRVNMSKCQNLQGRIRASARAELHVNSAFQGGVLDSISRPSFEDRPALKELYDMSPDVLGRRFLEFLYLQPNSLNRPARFCKLWRDFGFPNHNAICRKNETENNSRLFILADEIAMVFLSREGGRLCFTVTS